MTPFAICLDALRQHGLPDALFKAIDRAMADTVGHRLFTLFYGAGRQAGEAPYTNMLKEYSVGSYNSVTETPWHKRVIGERRAWVGYNAKDSE